jgi:sulfate adenylyltransferase subunit 2
MHQWGEIHFEEKNKSSKSSERGARMDDKRSEAALEQRKKGGYF